MPELTGRELDVAVAKELFGWSDFTFEPCGLGPVLVYGCNPGARDRQYVEDYHRLTSLTWTIEVEIERRGLVDQYIRHLAHILGWVSLLPPVLSVIPEDIFRFRRATPEQICRAALAAVRGAGNDPAHQLP